MRSIAQAVVRVRPDLTGFASTLRTDLQKQINLVGLEARTVRLHASFQGTTKIYLAEQLSKLGPIPVRVKPYVLQADRADLSKQIGIIPVTVRVVGTTGKAAISGAVSAETAAGAGVAGAAAASGAIASAGKIAQVPAVEALQESSKQIIAIRSELQAGTLSLVRANELLTQSEKALADAETAEKAAAASGMANRSMLASGIATDARATAALAREKQGLAAAEDKLAAARQMQGTVASAGVGMGAAAATRAERTAAEKASKLAGEAATIAGGIGPAGAVLAVKAKDLQAAAAADAQLRTQTLATNVSLKERAGIEGAIARINEKMALGQDPTRSANARLGSLNAAARTASRSIDNFAKSTSAATVEDIAMVKSLQAEIVGFQNLTKAEIDATAAAEKTAAVQAKQSVTMSQVRRGAIGTSAGFLGLRGAILSASSGFLAATIAVMSFAKIVGAASSLQKSLNIFQSVSGATADQMARVSKQAQMLGADLTLPATSASDAATAMTELSKAGLSVNDTLDAARGVLELAAAANMSVGDSANIVATELNAFGLAGSQATHVADLLAGASVAAQGEISDFALAFQQVSAVAHQVKLPLETTTAILTQFAKAGLKSSDAGTSLRTMLLRMVPTTKTATTAQAELGIKIDRSIPIGKQFLSLVDQYTRALAKLGPIAQQESLTKIFGQDAIRGASISLTKGSAALIATQAEVDKAGKAGEIANARMRGLSGAAEGLKSAISTLAATVGTTMLPALESITRELASITTGANEVVTAIGKVGGIKIGGVGAKSVGNALGGTDAIAQVAIAAGLGLGVNEAKQWRDRRAMAKAEVAQVKAEEQALRQAAAQTLGVQVKSAETAAAANVAAATTSAGAWEKETAAVVVSAKVATTAEVTAAGEMAAANVAAATTSASAWGRLSALKGRLSGGMGALGLGVVATLAGSKLQESGKPGVKNEIGGVLAGAGQGAIIGGMVGGVPGAVVGGIGGALFGAITTARSEQAAENAKWNNLDAKAQWYLVYKMGPDRAKLFFRLTGLELKPNPYNAQVSAIIDSTAGMSAVAPGVAPSGALANVLKGIQTGTSALGAEFNITAKMQAQIDLATANLAGNTESANAALKKLSAIDKRQAAALQASLDAASPITGYLIKGKKQREKIQQAIIQLLNEAAGYDSQSAKAEAAAFSVPVNIQVAGIKAGTTKTLTDDLAAQQDVAAATAKALEHAVHATKKDQKEIDSLTIQLAQANANVTNTSNQIQQQNLTDAQTRLQMAADAAGNIGAAENKYIVFLRKQANDASKTTSEQLAAQNALAQEIDKRKNALQGIIDAASQLRTARIDTMLAKAQLTQTPTDDIRAYNAKIKQDNDEIARMKKIVASEGAKSKAGIDALIKIEGYKQDIINQQQNIKNANGTAGTFTLDQLFARASEEFKAYAGFGKSIVSMQGARAFVAKDILSQVTATASGVGSSSPKPIASRNFSAAIPVGASVKPENRLETVATSTLSENQKQTRLLQQVVNNTKPDKVPPKTKAETKRPKPNDPNQTATTAATKGT